MKALTIQQPYAHLIALPDDHDRAKRVENRTWATDHVGQLAIHAGKGRDYLTPDDEADFPGMHFGSIVAVAQLRGCVQLEIGGIIPPWALRKWPWLATHEHAEGPVCWVLAEVRALKRPVQCRGAQGLWTVPGGTLAAVEMELSDA